MQETETIYINIFYIDPVGCSVFIAGTSLPFTIICYFMGRVELRSGYSLLFLKKGVALSIQKGC